MLFVISALLLATALMKALIAPGVHIRINHMKYILVLIAFGLLTASNAYAAGQDNKGGKNFTKEYNVCLGGVVKDLRKRIKKVRGEHSKFVAGYDTKTGEFFAFAQFGSMAMDIGPERDTPRNILRLAEDVIGKQEEGPHLVERCDRFLKVPDN